MIKTLLPRRTGLFFFLGLLLAVFNLTLVPAYAFEPGASVVVDQQSRALVAPAGYTYQWYLDGSKLDQEKANTLAVQHSGMYVVELTNAAGKVTRQRVMVQVQKNGAIKRVFLIGDSTVADYAAGYYPQAGWGQVLPHFFDKSQVQILNRAVGGTSSKSFYDSFWPAVKNDLAAGDYVFIQFGHNDGKKDDPARYTSAFTTYKEYLTNFVREARAKGAFPILVTPMHRNSWTGPKMYNAWHDYPDGMRQVASEQHVPLIDLHFKSEELFESLGQAYVTDFLFLHLQPGEYPRSPAGVADNVHFKEMGAIELAKLVTQGIQELAATEEMGALVPHLKPLYKVSATTDLSDSVRLTRTASYPAGLTVTLKAILPSGYNFLGWDSPAGNRQSIHLNYSFQMPEREQSFQAIFGQHQISSVESGATYWITARHSNLYLDVYGNSLNNAAGIVQAGYSGNESQQWLVREVGDGYYTLTAVNSNKSMDVEGRSVADGAKLLQYTTSSTGSTNQQFRIDPTGDGYYHLIARHSGKCLEVPEASTEPGMNLRQGSYSGNTNQQYAFYRVTVAATQSKIFHQPSVRVFPNPTSNSFRIQAEGPFQYTVLNELGQEVESGHGDSVAEAGAVLKAGFYVVRLQTERGYRVLKIVKH